MKRGTVAIAMALSLSCAPSQDSPATSPSTAFLDVNLVDLHSGSVLPHQTLIAADGAISWIGPAGESDLPPDVRAIPAQGRYLMPGLADLHVHMSPNDARLFIANGITTVREMNGSPAHLALRDSIESGQRAGPRMFVASPLLAGEEQPWRHELISTPEAARQASMEYVAAGYDFLKVYDGLSRKAYDAIIETSRREGVAVIGHIPRSVGLDAVLRSGQASIEHVEQIAHAVQGEPSEELIRETAERIARSGIAVTPTLAAMRMLAMRGTEPYAERLEKPEVRYVDESLLEWWRAFAPAGDPHAPGPDEAQLRERAAYYEALAGLTLALHRHGVPLLVGTDTPNPLLVPGYSIHLEIAALVDAGIPVTAVLRAATEGAATFLGDEGRWGTLRPGAAADLLLLDRNPLEEPATLADPAGVMLRGTWLDRAALLVEPSAPSPSAAPGP